MINKIKNSNVLQKKQFRIVKSLFNYIFYRPNIEKKFNFNTKLSLKKSSNEKEKNHLDLFKLTKNNNISTLKLQNYIKNTNNNNNKINENSRNKKSNSELIFNSFNSNNSIDKKNPFSHKTITETNLQNFLNSINNNNNHKNPIKLKNHCLLLNEENKPNSICLSTKNNEDFNNNNNSLFNINNNSKIYLKTEPNKKKKYSKKISLKSENNNNNNNLVNFVNTNDDKNIEINFNKYEIKLLSDNKKDYNNIVNNVQNSFINLNKNEDNRKNSLNSTDSNFFLKKNHHKETKTLKIINKKNSIKKNFFSEKNKRKHSLYISPQINLAIEKDNFDLLSNNNNKNNFNTINFKDKLIPCSQNNFFVSSSIDITTSADGNYKRDYRHNTNHTFNIQNNINSTIEEDNSEKNIINSKIFEKKSSGKSKESFNNNNSKKSFQNIQNNILSRNNNKNKTIITNNYKLNSSKTISRIFYPNMSNNILNKIKNSFYKSEENNNNNNNNDNNDNNNDNNSGSSFLDKLKKHKMENLYERSIKKNNTLTLHNKFNLNFNNKINNNINNNNNNNNNNNINNNNEFSYLNSRNQTKEQIKNLKNSLIDKYNSNFYHNNSSPFFFKKNTCVPNYHSKLSFIQSNNQNEINFFKNSNKSIKLMNKKFQKQLSKISEFSSHLNDYSLLLINNINNLNLNKSCFNLSTNIKLNQIENKKIKKSKTFIEINSNKFFSLIISKKNLIKNNKINFFSRLKSISSSQHNTSFSMESHKRKKVSKKKISSGPVNFFNLRQNSVRIDNFINNDNIKNEEKINQSLFLKQKKFLNKFSNYLQNKFEKIQNLSYSKKDDFIFKSVIKIDNFLTKNEKKNKKILKENINNILISKNINSFYLIKKIIKKKIFFEEDFINKYYLLFLVKLLKNKKKINIFSENFIHEKYFSINIYDLIIKGIYLNDNIFEEENSITIFDNFSLNKKLKKKTFKNKNYNRSKAIKSNDRNFSSKRNIIFFNHINIKFYNHFMQKEAGIVDFNINDFDKNFNENFSNKLLLNKTFNLNNFNLSKKSSFFSKKTNRKSFSFKKAISKLKLSQSISYDFHILDKNFYNRIRDTLINEEFSRNQKKQLSLIEEIKKNKEQLLFISPFKSNKFKTVNKTFFDSNVHIFNKESMMYKTHKLKTQMFKKCKNINDLLFLFIKDGNFQTFKEKFNKFKINPENKDKNGNSYLNLAVQCDCKKIVDFLLSSGADVNSQNNRLNTPLHYALGYQNFVLADVLIKNGADEQCKNADGITPWQSINSKHTIHN